MWPNPSRGVTAAWTTICFHTSFFVFIWAHSSICVFHYCFFPPALLQLHSRQIWIATLEDMFMCYYMWTPPQPSIQPWLRFKGQVLPLLVITPKHSSKALGETEGRYTFTTGIRQAERAKISLLLLYQSLKIKAKATEKSFNKTWDLVAQVSAKHAHILYFIKPQGRNKLCSPAPL